MTEAQAVDLYELMFVFFICFGVVSGLVVGWMVSHVR